MGQPMSPAATLEIDPNSSVPLHEQVAGAIRRAISGWALIGTFAVLRWRLPLCAREGPTRTIGAWM